jgi:hypothetical protein
MGQRTGHHYLWRFKSVGPYQKDHVSAWEWSVAPLITYLLGHAYILCHNHTDYIDYGKNSWDWIKALMWELEMAHDLAGFETDIDRIIRLKSGH